LKQKGHYFLWVDESLWMWDIPIERINQRKIAEKAFDDVLVAGYGLGLVQEYLAKNPKVHSITSIEKLGGVIRECKKVYGKVYENIVVADFYKYNPNHKFDCVIGDIWADITPESLSEYNKFFKQAKRLIKKKGSVVA